MTIEHIIKIVIFSFAFVEYFTLLLAFTEIHGGRFSGISADDCELRDLSIPFVFTFEPLPLVPDGRPGICV